MTSNIAIVCLWMRQNDSNRAVISDGNPSVDNGEKIRRMQKDCRSQKMSSVYVRSEVVMSAQVSTESLSTN